MVVNCPLAALALAQPARRRTVAERPTAVAVAAAALTSAWWSALVRRRAGSRALRQRGLILTVAAKPTVPKWAVEALAVRMNGDIASFAKQDEALVIATAANVAWARVVRHGHRLTRRL